MNITLEHLLKLIKEAVDTDGDGELSSRELRQLADELEKGGSADPVDELISYIQTLTPDDEIGISEVENMLYSQGHSAEEIDDVLEDLLLCWSIKWRCSTHKLIGNNTKRPPVNSKGMFPAKKDLRSHVIWCAWANFAKIKV